MDDFLASAVVTTDPSQLNLFHFLLQLSKAILLVVLQQGTKFTSPSAIIPGYSNGGFVYHWMVLILTTMMLLLLLNINFHFCG